MNKNKSAEALFKSLLREATEAQEEKRKSKAKAKTQGESRKAREQKTAQRRLNSSTTIKETLAQRWERGERRYENEHIKIYMQERHCETCDNVQTVFDRGELWANQLMRTGERFSIMLNKCQHKGTFEFYDHLPLQVHRVFKSTPFCASCINKETKDREIKK